MKRVLVEPAGRMHLFFEPMFSHPPEGYEFVFQRAPWDRLVAPILSSDTLYFTLQRRVLSPILPVPLVKAYLESFLKKPPQGIDLTYAIHHLVFRKEPWVVQLEWVHQLAGFNYAHLRRFRRVVERTLASPYCKKILCWCELAKTTVLAHLNCDSFLHKIEVVPYAAPLRSGFTKTYDDGKVRMLFVGSGNTPAEFYTRGGNVALEAFKLLSGRYDNLELVIASDMPRDIKKQCQGFPNITIIEEHISKSQEVQERVFGCADILLFPAHITAMVILEAMSYELPIVATDIYATREIVGDGKTGFLIKPAKHVPYYVAEYLPTGPGDSLDRRFKKAMERTDSGMVRDMVAKTAILIENAELRRHMGKAGRWEVEQGKFSLQRRNEKLRQIFDEAAGLELLPKDSRPLERT